MNKFKITEEETVPEAWDKSYLIKNYKDKEDPLQCKNVRGIKLLEVGLKELEKVMDKSYMSNTVESTLFIRIEWIRT